jgi:hypothetical protein
LEVPLKHIRIAEGIKKELDALMLAKDKKQDVRAEKVAYNKKYNKVFLAGLSTTHKEWGKGEKEQSYYSCQEKKFEGEFTGCYWDVNCPHYVKRVGDEDDES